MTNKAAKHKNNENEAAKPKKNGKEASYHKNNGQCCCNLQSKRARANDAKH